MDSLKRRLRLRLSALIRTDVEVVARSTTPWVTSTITGKLEDQRFDHRDGTVFFENATIRNVDFSDVSFDMFGARASTFEECTFRGSIWHGGYLGDVPQAYYLNCSFDGADLRHVRPRYARFIGCSFSGARLDHWDAMCAEFVACRFAGPVVKARFSAVPWGSSRQGLASIRDSNEFRSNDFSHADLIDSSFLGGIDLDQNLWPGTDNYVIIRDAQSKIAALQRELSQEPERATAELLAAAEVFSRGGYAHQRDLLLRHSDHGAFIDLLLAQEAGSSRTA